MTKNTIIVYQAMFTVDEPGEQTRNKITVFWSVIPYSTVNRS
jgi:hypothetical protein